MSEQNIILPVYRYDIIVPEEAVDENGHVNNVEYIRWMQEAAICHSDSHGCTAATRAAGAIWVVRMHRIEYLRPAFAGEKISVLTWVSSFRRVLTLRKYRFVRFYDNAVIAEGETDWVFVDIVSGKPRSIPKEVSSVFVVVPDDKETEYLIGINGSK
ncbi:MAG TPA: acyl-CoA thioesterase [Syntrophales bacterium]|nr:acyl-CoA thioesterase [Syntrophales bacterium]